MARKSARNRDGELEIGTNIRNLNVGGSALADNNLRFAPATEQTSINGMKDVNSYLMNLQEECSLRHDITLRSAESLNLSFEDGRYFIDPDPSRFSKTSEIGSWFKKNGRMYLSDVALESACSLINRKRNDFVNFSSPDARFINEFNDWFRSNRQKGLKVRTIVPSKDKEEQRFVDSFVDENYNALSRHDILVATINAITESYGDCIRGIENVGDSSFRLIFGNPVLEEDHVFENSVWLMLSFTIPENQLDRCFVSLSLWRMICLNGMVRRDCRFLNASWNHKGSEKKFIENIGHLINKAGSFGRYMSGRLGGLLTEKVNDPMRVTYNLYDQKLLSDLTFGEVLRQVNTKKEMSCYDYMNAWTHAAKLEYSHKKRELSETNALMVAMQPGSFNKVSVDGIDKRSQVLSNRQFARELVAVR
jgi:hypothetical protein